MDQNFPWSYSSAAIIQDNITQTRHADFILKSFVKSNLYTNFKIWRNMNLQHIIWHVCYYEQLNPVSWRIALCYLHCSFPAPTGFADPFLRAQSLGVVFFWYLYFLPTAIDVNSNPISSLFISRHTVIQTVLVRVVTQLIQCSCKLWN